MRTIYEAVELELEEVSYYESVKSSIEENKFQNRKLLREFLGAKRFRRPIVTKEERKAEIECLLSNGGEIVSTKEADLSSACRTQDHVRVEAEEIAGSDDDEDSSDGEVSLNFYQNWSEMATRSDPGDIFMKEQGSFDASSISPLIKIHDSATDKSMTTKQHPMKEFLKHYIGKQPSRFHISVRRKKKLNKAAEENEPLICKTESKESTKRVKSSPSFRSVGRVYAQFSE